MKRRLVVLGLLVTGLSGGTSAASAIGSMTASGGYWGCAGTRHVDFGVCVENPLPERLPAPEVPGLPT